MRETVRDNFRVIGGVVLAILIGALVLVWALNRGGDLTGADNLGDADAVPAEEAGGALTTGDFELLETRPPNYDDVTGSAALARTNLGTTATVRFNGLPPNTNFVAHVHDAPCSGGGGDHYKFDPDGPTVPPNEIHLAFTSDDDGKGFMTAENERTAGPEAVSVVVHPEELMDNRIACADLA